MTRSEIEAKLREILVNDFRVAPEKVTNDATFRGTLGLDSLDAVDFIYLATTAFSIKKDLEAFRELHTFAKVTDYIESEVKKHASSS